MKLCSAARKRMHADPRQAGWVQVGLLVLSVGLSILAGKMLAKKSDSPVKDDSPTTLATRGSYMSWFIGIRSVGPVFCWAGDREKRKEKVEGGGKGGDTPEQDVFYEAGWHVLGVGPCEALHKIVQGGKVIFNGPITRESHPSGTTVNLGKEGSFRIFWGEELQPINTFLGGAERVTINSRWPFMCYIEWNKKRLGGSPVWPLVEYVLERRPSTGLLTDSEPWYEPNLTLTGPTYGLTGFVSSADENVGYLEVSGDRTAFFKTRTFVQLTGNGLPNGQYEVLRSTTVLVTVGMTLNGYPIKETRTRVFLQGGTLGANAAGTIQVYEADDSDGANIAHSIAELLFAPFPQGMAHDPDGLEPWDLPSLEALGVEAEDDEWRASLYGSEGETGEALLGAALQDHGTMLPIDTVTGKLSFRRVRFPTGTLPNLSSSIYANSLPEIETMHGERPVDKLIFAFKDRARNFGDMTIAIDEDGQANYEEQQRARKVPIVSTVQFFTAAALAELRSPEELAAAGEFRMEASREARDLIPGDAILADGFEEVLRVTSVGVDPLSERVKVNVLPDFYGARKTDFVNGNGGGEPVIEDPEQDAQADWIEVPEQLLGGIGIGEQTILVPHIRAHNQISFASLWLSADDITYTLWGNDPFIQTGGVLQTSLSSTGPTFVVQGPNYDERGPDNGSLTQDLSADPTNWLLGRQLAVIVSTAGVEICFLQRATIVMAGVRRLDGLLRARWDTRKLDHPAGAKVYIFDRDAILPVSDALLQPLVDLYVKTQPGTTAGQVSLSAVPPIGEELAGKGVVPIRPDYVHLRAPRKSVPAYATGEGVTVSWALSSGSPGTGAGGQNAGLILGDPVIPGTVLVELLTTGDVVVATKSVDADTTELTFSNAEIVAALGSEVNFKLRATHIANGQVSLASPSLTVTKV